jgi:3-oxoacyl-[acyl-carrier protein] reductase
MDLGLSGRVYVLTGASRGLGFATARCLVDDGAKVVVSARDPGTVADAVERLGGPASAAGVPADLTAAETPDLLLDTARSAFGRFDGALISVGGPPRGTAASITDDQWRASFETVFLGAVRTARVFGAALSSGGVVGFVLSSTARSPVDDLGISNALRPGLAGAAKDMADEWAPRGVRVISLLPGRILTDRNRELMAASGDAAAAQAEAAAAIPLRRMGEPEEFGRVAAFALSPAAGYLTGVSIPVDGGLLRTP